MFQGGLKLCAQANHHQVTVADLGGYRCTPVRSRTLSYLQERKEAQLMMSSNLSVLCIEPDQEACDIIGRSIATLGTGIKTRFASDLREAFASIKRTQPDIYILSSDLPAIHQMLLISEIRSQQKERHTVVLVSPGKLDQHQSIRKGLNTVTKPIEMNEIMLIVNKIIHSLVKEKGDDKDLYERAKADFWK